MNSLVSVVIPVYNRETTIQRAIDSVLNQTYSNIEVLIIDDGSLDKTVELVHEYEDIRIKLYSFGRNMGANVARNKGIMLAHGEYIAFQDSDDEWKPDKLQKQIKYMQDNNLSAVYCPYRLIEGQNERIVPVDYQNVELYETNLQDRLKTGNVIGTPTLVVRREMVIQVGLFDESMPRLQDYDLVLRLIKSGKIGYVAEPLVTAYRMSVSICGNRKNLLIALAKLLEKYKDFINIEIILTQYYEKCDIFDQREICWENIERINNTSNRVGEGNDLLDTNYKVLMEQIYSRYIKPYFALQHINYINYSNFIRQIKSFEFAIYGAGYFGKKVKKELEEKGYIPKCFFVTRYGNYKQIEGIEVKELACCEDKRIPIIIAVSLEKQEEVICYLIESGFNNYCIYCDM